MGTHHKALVDVLESRYEELVKSFGGACEISTKYLHKQKKQREEFGFGANKKKSYRKVPINRLQRRRRHAPSQNDNESEPLLSDNSHSFKGGGQLALAQSQMTLQK